MEGQLDNLTIRQFDNGITADEADYRRLTANLESLGLRCAQDELSEQMNTGRSGIYVLLSKSYHNFQNCYFYTMSRVLVFLLFLLMFHNVGIVVRAQTIDGWLPVVGALGDTIRLRESIMFHSKNKRLIMLRSDTNKLGMRYYLSEWNDTNFVQIDSGLNTLYPKARILAICDDDTVGHYIAGGPLNDSGHWFVARWNGKNWKPVGGISRDTLPAYFAIHSMCMDKRKNIYISTYDIVGLKPTILQWNGLVWRRIDTCGGILDGNCKVFLAGNDDSTVFAAGNFFTKGGFHSIAKWDGSKWSLVGAPSKEYYTPYNISLLCKDSKGNIYAAGDIADNRGRTGIIRWDGKEWTFVGAGAAYPFPTSNPIDVLYIDDADNLYIEAQASGRRLPPHVYKWQGKSWKELGTPPRLLSNSLSGAYVSDLFRSEKGELYASGYFRDSVTRSRNFAIYKTDIHLTAEQIIPSMKGAKIFPNPTSGNVIVSLNLQESAEINLFSISGTLIEQKKFTPGAGTEISFDMDTLPTGTYLISINAGGKISWSQLELTH
jgi:hypothetical protein